MVIDVKSTFTTLNCSRIWSQGLSLSQIHQGLTDLFWDKKTALIKVLTFPQTLCPYNIWQTLEFKDTTVSQIMADSLPALTSIFQHPLSSPHQEQRGPPLPTPLLVFYYLCEKCLSMLHEGAPIIPSNVASVFLAQRFKHTDVFELCPSKICVRVFIFVRVSWIW